MLNEDKNATAISFSRYLSLIYSIFIFCLMIVKLIFTLKTKMKATIFSLHIVHLIIGIIFNVVSYLIGFAGGHEGTPIDSLACKFTAVFHITSLNFLINLLFIFYLISLLSVKSSEFTKKISFHIGIYVINGIIIILFGVFYFIATFKPMPNELNICRYVISFREEEGITPANTNAVYSIVMLIAIIVCFCMLKCSLRRLDVSVISPSSSQKVDKILETFIVILVILSLQFLSLLLSFIDNGKYIIHVLDRIFEHAGFAFVMIFLVLPRKELKEYFCCCCKEKNFTSKSEILEEIRDTDKIAELEDDY